MGIHSTAKNSCDQVSFQTTSQSVLFDFRTEDATTRKLILMHSIDFDLSPIFQSKDVDFIWSFIEGAILSLNSLFTPVVEVRSHQFPKWFTP